MEAEAQQVCIGLLDGSELSGIVRAFCPEDPELFLRSTAPEGEAPSERRLAAESVAWVGLYRPEGTIPAEHEAGATTLRAHLAQGSTLTVIPTSDSRSPLGFWGKPFDYESPYEAIWLYAHGWKALERDETLGAMLIDQGLVAREDLERGLERQAALRRRRIGEILLEQKRIEPAQLDHGLALQQRRKARLGEVLVEAGLVSNDDIEEALQEQRQHQGRRIGEILGEMGVLTERDLAETLAEKFHLPFVDLDTCVIDPAALAAIPSWIFQRHRILPIEIENKQLTVALGDPLDTEPVDLIRFDQRVNIREVIAMPSQIDRYRAELLAKVEEDLAVDSLIENLEIEPDGDAEADSDVHDPTTSDNALIQLANQILLEAVRRGASDVHIEPNGQRGGVRVRFRIDGECISMPEVPGTLRQALVSRLKIMASLDIAERRKPQDGKIRFKLPDRTVELRVATLPTVGGEDVVLRILSASKPFPLDQLNLTDANRQGLERLVRNPYGMILCVGPTGSGKSTTLHSLLGHINTPDRKIWTAEDPVEITQRGLRQVQVRPKIGFGFAEALRSFLRADPDVIMIGEMRDRETANIAIEASLTGHLMLSTLHTNNAPETIVRLVKMGLDPFSFADALLGVLAQRLVRKLCTECRELEPATETDHEALVRALGKDGERAGRLLWQAHGCDACRGTGYQGRVPLHELLVVDEAMRTAVHSGASADEIREIAEANGMKTLLGDGARKCLDGTTDLKQVLAACSR